MNVSKSVAIICALAAVPLFAAGSRDSSDSLTAQWELQGLYDEISQADLQFNTGSDVDLFHDVICTPDWTFADASGNRQAWAARRETEIQAFRLPRFDSIYHRIQKFSLVADGATVVVSFDTVRRLVDQEGRYGPKGGVHRISETTVYRDAWVRAGDTWKMRSREQIGPPVIVVDKRESLY